MGWLVVAGPCSLIAMLDIEYLLAPLPIERHIIYRYRSGWLKPHVTSVLQNQVAALGMQLAVYPLEPYQPLDGGLFADAAMQGRDWADPSRAKAADPSRAKARESLLSRLATGQGKPTAHFIPIGGPTDAFPRWSDIEAQCLVIEEPLIHATNVDSYLRYYVSQTDLVISMKQLESSGFISRFKHENEGPGCELGVFFNALELHVLEFVDPVTGAIDFDGLADEDDQALSIRRCLRRFLETGDTRDLVRFVTTSARQAHREGWTSLGLTSELYRITLALFSDMQTKVSRDGIPALSYRPASLGWRRRLVIWAITLLIWEARLTHHAVASRTNFMRAPDPFVGLVDQMCRHFMANEVRDRAAERCEPDLWRHGNEALARAVKESALAIPSRRAKLVRQVASVGKTLPRLPWMREVVESASAAVKAMAPPKAKPASAAQSH